jgi:hypothetical protein
MAASEASHLAANVTRFARLLRSAGVPVGIGRTLAAVKAAACVGIESRAELRAALAATLLDRPEQRALFERAFALFWQRQATHEKPLALPPQAAPRRKRPPSEDAQATSRGPAGLAASAATAGREDALEASAGLAVSQREVLRRRDFEAMTEEERHEARRMIAELELPLPSVTTRRYRGDPRGPEWDLRATLRRSLRYGAEWILPCRRRRVERTCALVALCDISGSMAAYSRMLLHFLHALALHRPQVHAFAFGTQLTPITRALRRRDVDDALQAASRQVADWSGGTRIGECLHAFNRHWARRLLRRDAIVLLISDGLDAGEGPDLAREMQRLRRSCRAIVWLNPLLRFPGFEPRAAGIRAILPYVDHFLPAHDIESLAGLGRTLAQLNEETPFAWPRTMETATWK